MSEAIDLTVFDQLRVLGPALVTVVDKFESESARRCQELHTAFDAADPAQLAEGFHALKGASATLGAHEVVAECVRGEDAADCGDWDLLDRAFLNALSARCERAVDALRALLHS